MIKRVMSVGGVARAKLLKGALIVGEAVGMSLGPKGRNAIIIHPYHPPKITNDGVTIARNIVLEDEIEDLGAQTVVEAAMQTNRRAGDGTTTTIVQACKLIEDCARKIAEEDESTKASGVSAGADVVGMARAINEAKDIVIARLKEIARPVKKGDIKNIISTSLGKIYPEFIDSLTEIIDKVGLDGYIAVEDNWSTKYGVETQVVDGMRFLGSYCSPFMVNTRNKEAMLENVYVLVTNHRIESLTPIQNILKELDSKGIKRFVIIAEGYSSAMNKTFATTTVSSRRGDPRCIDFICVKAPSLTTDQFRDVVAFTGGKFFDKNISEHSLQNATIDMMGFVKKIVVDEDDTNMSGGKSDVKKRIEELKAELETEKDPSFKEQTKRRIGALSSGFAVIRVGAATEPEREYIRYKMEDAVNAAKAALEEGIVPGGGLALQSIAEELGEKNILYGMLNAPHEKIKSNAGGDISVPKTVIDPVKVTRLAVENACSVAAQLITAEVAITNKEKSLMDELDRNLAPKENSDFRDPENEEVGYKT